MRLKKSLGQNFMVSQKAVSTLVKKLDLSSHDLVLEIGPGTGALTKRIYQITHNILAVEIDTRFAQLLSEQLPDITVINENILNIDIAKRVNHWRKSLHSTSKIKIISNLPYYITTPVLLQIIDSDVAFERMVLTMQKEVAERILAHEGGKTYGSLTVKVRYHTQTRKIADFPPSYFIPQPKVTSSAVLFRKREKPPIEVKDVALFFEVVKTGFSQRRKYFRNTLLHNKKLQLSSDQVTKLFETLDLSAKTRAETCSLEDFARIADEIKNSV